LQNYVVLNTGTVPVGCRSGMQKDMLWLDGGYWIFG
jgi:hypothetical protein